MQKLMPSTLTKLTALCNVKRRYSQIQKQAGATTFFNLKYPPKKAKMLHKSTFKDAIFFPEKKMVSSAAGGGSAPIAIGTRGTVGSLLKKEIEYFAKFELEAQGTVGGSSSGGRSWKSGVRVEMDCSNCRSRSGFWFSIVGWKQKKGRSRNDGGFLPSMCSAIEVADMNRFNRIPGFNYRILKNDVHNFRV